MPARLRHSGGLQIRAHKHFLVLTPTFGGDGDHGIPTHFRARLASRTEFPHFENCRTRLSEIVRS